MKITYSVEQLDSEEAWTSLAIVLGGPKPPPAVNNIIRHLKVLCTECYVLEDRYIDRDYSEDYWHFYARTFRDHDRHCKRVHFFSGDIALLFQRPLSSERIRAIHDCSNTTYCGFCVIRPLPTAPIGRTILTGRVHGKFDMESSVTCRAEFSANLLGVNLTVTGASFLQQDARVGACAQVAIWTGMRHMHARHGYNWASVADITKFAKPTTSSEAVSLPAGSDFLTSERMIRGISEAGYQPLCFSGLDIGRDILPYVDSGIPVILGLSTPDQTLGHAVTVVGRVFAKQNNPTKDAIDYVPAYIVHDDQRGPYRWLPMSSSASNEYSFTEDTIKCNAPEGTVELNVQCHAVFAVALMSTRVFSTAAAAERAAEDRISSIVGNLQTIRQKLEEFGLPVNERLLDDLQVAYTSDQIVLRTYLTSAAGYRRHLLEGSACDELKDALLDYHLPHFTWITEISTIDSYNNASLGMRRIYGHTIIDATTSMRGRDDMLALHIPGLLVTRDINALEDKDKLDIIENDRLYECREKRLNSHSV